MRIAYVSLHWSRTVASGVGKKIVRQINAWTLAGHEVQLFMHGQSREKGASLIPGEVFFYPEGGRLAGEWGRMLAARRLLSAVKLYNPDVIYLRYGIYVYPIHRLASIAPVIEEVTTNDLAQHRRLGHLYDLYNRLTRGIILRRTSGLVCLSRELANSPGIAIYQKPIEVIGDGVDLAYTQPLKAPNNRRPHLVFIGSPDAPWQGVDKLVLLANLLPDLSIHVIGYDYLDKFDVLPANLILHGYLETDQYKKVLAKMDLAMSSLALHRIGMNESSPLKTRECLAYGLPIILPYVDTDLHDLDCDFILEIPNTEDNVKTHADLIRDFAYRMRGRRADQEILVSRIDSRQKELVRLSFFDKIARSSD